MIIQTSMSLALAMNLRETPKITHNKITHNMIAFQISTYLSYP